MGWDLVLIGGGILLVLLFMLGAGFALGVAFMTADAKTRERGE